MACHPACPKRGEILAYLVELEPLKVWWWENAFNFRFASSWKYSVWKILNDGV